MATTVFFEETVIDQGGRSSFELEIGRCSAYKDDSLYFRIDGKMIIFNLETASKIIDAINGVDNYLGITSR